MSASVAGRPAVVDDRSPALVRRFVRLTGLVAAASFVFGATYVVELLDRGFSPTVVSTAFFCALAASTVLEVVSGDWGDRFGQRRMAVGGLVLWGAGLVVFGISHSFGLLVVALVLWALGQATYSGAPTALIVNAIPPGDAARRRAAVRWGQTARFAGAVVAGVLVLLRPPGLSPAGLIVAAGCALLVLAGYVRLRLPYVRADAPLPGRLTARIGRAWSGRLDALLTLCVVNAGLLSVFLFAWQPVATTVIGLGGRWLGALLSGLTALAALGAWAARFTVEHHRVRDLDLYLGTAVTAVALAVMGTSAVAAWTAFVTVEVAAGYVVAVAATRAHAEFPDASRNVLWSMFSAAMGTSMAVADLALGLVWDRVGLAVALGLVVPAESAIGAALGVVLRRRSRRSPAGQSSVAGRERER